MFEKFVLWLATRFLGELAVIQLFTKKVFEPNGSAAFQAVVESTDPDNLKDSFNVYAMQHLTARFDHAELGFIHALLAIKESSVDDSAVLNNFTTQLESILLGNNALKVNKELQNLVLRFTYITDEKTIKSIANALQVTGHISPSLIQFIKQV